VRFGVESLGQRKPLKEGQRRRISFLDRDSDLDSDADGDPDREVTSRLMLQQPSRDCYCRRRQKFGCCTGTHGT